MMTQPSDPQVKTVDGHTFYFDGNVWQPMVEHEPEATTVVEARGAVNVAAIIFIVLAIVGVIGAGIAAVEHSEQKQRDLEESCMKSLNDGFNICNK